MATYTATNTTETITTIVDSISSGLLGQTDFLNSWIISSQKRCTLLKMLGLPATAFLCLVVLTDMTLKPFPLAADRWVAGQEGLEPPTLGFGDRCSTN